MKKIAIETLFMLTLMLRRGGFTLVVFRGLTNSLCVGIIRHNQERVVMNYINVMGSTKKKRDLVESAVIFCISELILVCEPLRLRLTLKTSKMRVSLVGVTKVRTIVTSTLTLIKILMSKRWLRLSVMRWFMFGRVPLANERLAFWS